MGGIIYKKAITNNELHQILELQHRNIPTSISKEEKQNEGFVTVHHDFETLKTMNDACAHSIAIHNNEVIGYALSMVKDFKDAIAVLKPMFQEIEISIKPMVRYIVMGQVCVDKPYRKQGIFRGLYEFMRLNLKPDFDFVITEVDAKNTRSLNAHYAIGFKVLKTYISNNQKWVLLSWSWR
ncbi:hypothetical protein GCM10023311_12780 [Flaviramulus aquimarinus]|uniref:N-acetyltransferase domain-containing protein n=1 Tax=Flaviramulus aquimarinus TaxID=1170456 RepID=A0ABP9F0K6_9FLAO